VEKRKLVLVTWIDATVSFGWESIESINPDLAECQSVGWILNHDQPDSLVLIHTIAEPDCNGITRIPKKWIKSIVELKTGKK